MRIILMTISTAGSAGRWASQDLRDATFRQGRFRAAGCCGISGAGPSKREGPSKAIFVIGLSLDLEGLRLIGNAWVFVKSRLTARSGEGAIWQPGHCLRAGSLRLTSEADTRLIGSNARGQIDPSTVDGPARSKALSYPICRKAIRPCPEFAPRPRSSSLASLA
jgi:hypothetical protein